MNIDITRLIGAMSREVSNREHQGRPARVVVARRTYDTNIEDLWDALTSAERIPRWFLPISGDLRLGGRYQLQGNAGGEITQCEPPRHLAVTWEFGGEVTWVDVKLSEDARGGTRLELEHVAVDGDKWKEFGPGAVGVGWDLVLSLGLHEHLKTRASVDPAEAAAWSASEDGKSFMRQSSEDWCRAAIRAGEDEGAARAAAGRTAAAYTGEDTARQSAGD